jgi:hypothetical protein
VIDDLLPITTKPRTYPPPPLSLSLSRFLCQQRSLLGAAPPPPTHTHTPASLCLTLYVCVTRSLSLALSRSLSRSLSLLLFRSLALSLTRSLSLNQLTGRPELTFDSDLAFCRCGSADTGGQQLWASFLEKAYGNGVCWRQHCLLEAALFTRGMIGRAYLLL